MNSLVVIAITIIALYLGAMIYAGRQIPESISQTVYVLPRMGQWLFTVVMWAVAFLLLPQLMQISSDNTCFLAFLMIGGILGVGASPLVLKEKNTFHYVCAAVSGITSQLLVALNQPLLLLTWFWYVGYTLLAKDGSKNMFWVQFSCMLTVFAYCLTTKLFCLWEQ